MPRQFYSYLFQYHTTAPAKQRGTHATLKIFHTRPDQPPDFQVFQSHVPIILSLAPVLLNNTPFT